MKKIIRLMFVLQVILFFWLSASSQPEKGQSPFRIVGYYSLQSAMTDPVPNATFDQLTHINLWFLNPDSLGHFTQDLSSLAPFINAAHSKKVKVLASIGGGSSHPYYHTLLKEGKRAQFVEALVSVVLKSNLDGIDVDLEGGDIDENYEAFVTELAAALRPRNKLIAAAVAVYYKDALSDKALARYDFVSVMSYDRTGPWRPEQPGPHATYAHAVEDLAYFGVTRSLAKEKLVLGVPFYGYGFGPAFTSPAISMDYGEIVTRFPGAEASDIVTMPDGKILYYNGSTTIRQKAALAREKASGIMIWQVKGDAAGSLSLLKVINEVAGQKK